MLLAVRDGNNQQQTVTVQSQAAAVDRSGVLAATSVSQPAMPANINRSGYYIQNIGLNPMQVNELGGDASISAAAGAGSYVIQPGGTFPPPGFPVSVTPINIAGTIGDAWIARDW